MADNKDRSRAYKEAGVDIDAGNAFIKNIKDMVASTFTPGVVTGIGGFGGLFRPDLAGMKKPLLVSGADGVGTKLKLAFAFDKHDTVGIDLVAMSVNDVLVQGAKPLFFLDYFATGKLVSGVPEQVVSGVSEGCRQSECALLGGETAEMPGFYPDGEYDLSGFCVGMVDEPDLVDGSNIEPGQVIVGLASSGPHSNGYSLIRKLFDESGAEPSDIMPGSEKTMAEALLAPTTIYVKSVLDLLTKADVRGMVHVTGGGFYDNVPRVLPDNVCCDIEFGAWPLPPVFEWLSNQGDLTWAEMLQIFNCGIGYIAIMPESDVKKAVEVIKGHDIDAYVIGKVRERKGNEEQVKIVF